MTFRYLCVEFPLFPNRFNKTSYGDRQVVTIVTREYGSSSVSIHGIWLWNIVYMWVSFKANYWPRKMGIQITGSEKPFAPGNRATDFRQGPSFLLQIAVEDGSQRSPPIIGAEGKSFQFLFTAGVCRWGENGFFENTPYCKGRQCRFYPTKVSLSFLAPNGVTRAKANCPTFSVEKLMFALDARHV